MIALANPPGVGKTTLYSPYSDRLEFKKVYYGNKKGFGTRFKLTTNLDQL